MTNYSLTFDNVTKTFGRRLIFKDINCKLNNGKVYGFAGRNGSGKSTIIKISAGIISPTTGLVIHQNEDKKIISDKIFSKLGFVSPYLTLYDEFTAYENLYHFSRIRGIPFNKDRANFLLNKFELLNRKNDYLKGYSSGMKQRMKFIFALLHQPNLLLLDEPTSNLDTFGKDKVYEIIKMEAKNNLVIIASNEENDLALCDEIIEIEKFK